MEQCPRFDVFEVALASKAVLDNPFSEAGARAEFTAPGGRVAHLEGFYAGAGEWKVRFVPDEVGAWHYQVELTGRGTGTALAGSFECLPSQRHGFVRLSKRNPYRFEYDDGTPFYPIGQQLGWGVPPSSGFDGPAGETRANADRETFLAAFDGATNLIRSQLGCGTTAGVALDLLPGKEGLDRYDLEHARKLDESCQALKARGWAQVLIPFQDMSLWGGCETAFGHSKDAGSAYKSLGGKHLPFLERYLRYVVARWSAYVDIWELFNEDSCAPNDFLAHLARVIREADPYRHPITTNYERPAEPWCEIVCPHHYMAYQAHEVPGLLSHEFARLKSFGKPVLYTEFGNKGNLSNYDPVKWRVAAWTAFLCESGIVYWNMSGRRTSPGSIKSNANAYLGPDTREHFRILDSFTRELPIDLRPVLPGFTGQKAYPVQTWALSNGRITVLYLHQFKELEQEVQLLPLAVWTGPGRYRVRWMDPASGRTVREEELATEQFVLWLPAPAFRVDLAARLDRLDG